jgi:uncharacterized protein YraI
MDQGMGNSVLATTIDRRTLLRRIGGIGLAAALGIAVTAREASAATGYLRTTSALKLRTGPGTGRKVMAIMPAGTVVQSLEKSKNGFLYVSYQGTNGWAHGDFLESANGDGYEVPVPVGTARTTDAVNFRRSPSPSASVIRVLPAGTTVETFDLSENGYRMVGYAQTSGWIHADYLGDAGGPLGGYVVTTSALNLREEANMTSRVLAVMPKGAKAFRGDVIANDFLGVTYNGISGWAHKDYLQSV